MVYFLCVCGIPKILEVRWLRNGRSSWWIIWRDRDENGNETLGVELKNFFYNNQQIEKRDRMMLHLSDFYPGFTKGLSILYSKHI